MSRTAPNHAHRHLHAALRAAAVLLPASAAAWALLPMPAEVARFDPEPYTRIPDQPAESAQPLAVLDPAAFDVTLWHNPPPPVVAPEPRPAPPVRLTLELLAITTVIGDAGEPVPAAIVYDTADDTVHTLRVGDRIGGHTIESIENGLVKIQTGNRRAQLALEPAGAG